LADFCLSNWLNITSRNAAVLPVPVCACPATSSPSSASGKVRAWIGVQWVNFALSRPDMIFGFKLRLENDTSVSGLVDLFSVIIGSHFQAGKFIFADGLEIQHNDLEIVTQVIILIVLDSGFCPAYF